MNPIPGSGPLFTPPTQARLAASSLETALRREDELHLIRTAQAGDRRALQRLVDANIRLVYKIARRYRCRTYILDDLVQEGVVGLIHAVKRFDSTRQCRLSTYAVHWIRQAIARAVEQNDRLIHVPMHTHAEVRRVMNVREELEQSLCRAPTDLEVAESAGVPEERITALMGIAQDPVSFECAVGAEQDGCLLDLTEDPDVANPERDVLSGIYHDQLRRFLSDLRPRERQVLEERYGFGGGHPRTLDDLSRTLRISRERVRQIETAAIRKLRRALAAAELG